MNIMGELRLRIEQRLENLENEAKNRHMNDLEYGRYCTLNEVLELIDAGIYVDKFSIREVENGTYLTEENNGKYAFGKEEDRIIFYDEIEAESILEYLNDTTEYCCVLLDENK